MIEDAQVAILVYDITDKDSFTAIKKWADELKDQGPRNISTQI